MKYIDLSHEIKNEMPVYPGDKEVNLIKEKDYIENGYNSFSIATEMHAGTHIDAPLHMQENKSYISDYPIERFIGNIVLLFTGWDNFYGKEEYYTEHPVVSRELAELLIKKKIKMLGMDMPSPDRDNYEIHNVLFENDIFLLENLTNLNKLLYNEEIQLFAQPLKVQSEASLVRAVAIYQGY